MKYANYHYHGKNINNLGDHVQILAMDYLYQQMGISKEQIVYIDKDELASYDGEDVILPVSMPLIDYKEHGIAGMFSEKIHPVFLGLTMAKDTLLPEEVDYYKKHEPVGCRDERTYDTLCRYGIHAYLGGCITVTLRERKPCPDKQTKIFAIDVPDEVEPYIPKEFSERIVRGTHLFYGPMENPQQKAIERYEQYRDEAALVVTSLLHGAVPCMAMGIPVVLTRTVVSYRFAWLEALLPIYTPEQFSQIDWHPLPVQYDAHKKLVTQLIQRRLQGENAQELIQKVHDFYMNRNRKEYTVDAFLPIQDFIERNWPDKQKKYNYSVWGLTQMADMTVSYITRHYPNAKLCHVYDAKYTWKLGGINAIHPDNIAHYPTETVFVTTVSAQETARNFLQSLGREESSYCLLKVIR